jgi:hypothetical protein
MFAVEVNRNDGRGWEITEGPIPRAKARDLVKAYRETDKDGIRIRIVPTGTVKVSDKWTTK